MTLKSTPNKSSLSLLCNKRINARDTFQHDSHNSRSWQFSIHFLFLSLSLKHWCNVSHLRECKIFMTYRVSHEQKKRGRRELLKQTTVKFSFSIKNFVVSRTPSFAPQGHTVWKFDWDEKWSEKKRLNWVLKKGKISCKL